MRADESSWINSTDLARIGARPARFEAILGQVSPEQQQTELLSIIADARRHLRSYPASCTARERREAAFSDLYALGERSFGLTRGEIDAQYRLLEDDVFAELTYAAGRAHLNPIEIDHLRERDRHRISAVIECPGAKHAEAARPRHAARRLQRDP